MTEFEAKSCKNRWVGLDYVTIELIKTHKLSINNNTALGKTNSNMHGDTSAESLASQTRVVSE